MSTGGRWPPWSGARSRVSRPCSPGRPRSSSWRTSSTTPTSARSSAPRAALGFDAVLLAPRCADPLYRRAVKVAMGAVFSVPWTRLPDWYDALPGLSARGFTTVALTLAAGSVPIDEAVGWAGQGGAGAWVRGAWAVGPVAGDGRSACGHPDAGGDRLPQRGRRERGRLLRHGQALSVDRPGVRIASRQPIRHSDRSGPSPGDRDQRPGLRHPLPEDLCRVASQEPRDGDPTAALLHHRARDGLPARARSGACGPARGVAVGHLGVRLVELLAGPRG